MSYSDLPPTRPAAPVDAVPPAGQRSGCLTAFMVISGLVLLFPGLCALLVTGGQLDLSEIFSPLGLLLIMLLFGGIALIVWALRRRR